MVYIHDFMVYMVYIHNSLFARANSPSGKPALDFILTRNWFQPSEVQKFIQKLMMVSDVISLFTLTSMEELRSLSRCCSASLRKQSSSNQFDFS